jgi:hypothetical protein
MQYTFGDLEVIRWGNVPSVYLAAWTAYFLFWEQALPHLVRD